MDGKPQEVDTRLCRDAALTWHFLLGGDMFLLLAAAAIVIVVPDAGAVPELQRPAPVENPAKVVSEQAKACWNLSPDAARARFEIQLRADFDLDGVPSDISIVSIDPANDVSIPAGASASSALEGCGPYPIYLEEPAKLDVVLSP